MSGIFTCVVIVEKLRQISFRACYIFVVILQHWVSVVVIKQACCSGHKQVVFPPLHHCLKRSVFFIHRQNTYTTLVLCSGQI